MNIRYIVCFWWLISAGAFFVLGRFTKSGDRSSNEAVSDHEQIAKPLNTIAESPTSSVDTAVALVTSDAAAVTLDSVVSEVDSEIRKEKLSNLLRNADETALRALMAELNKHPESFRKSQILAAIFERWGRVSPETALATVAARPFRERRLREEQVLSGWVLVDPTQVWTWLREHPVGGSTPRERSVEAARYTQLIDILLSHEKAKTVQELLGSMQDDRLKMASAQKLAAYLAKYDFDNALQFALSEPNGLTRANAIATIGQTLAQEGELELAAQFAQQLPSGPDRARTLINVFQEWSFAGDIAQGVNWISRQRPSGELDAALAVFLPGAIGRDPDVAADLLNYFQGANERQRAIERSASMLLPEKPAAALNWAIERFEGTDRIAKLEQIAEQWASRDVTAARQFIGSHSQLSEDERTVLNNAVGIRPAQGAIP